MIELKLKRKKYTDKQTIGTMDVYKNGDFVCCLSTLELAWNNNEVEKSCIPKGIYPVKPYTSPKYKNAFILEETTPRTKILIHKGNYHTNTKGCILVGLSHYDINVDGYLDVSYSSPAILYHYPY